ncbi:MAG: sugar transferase [Chloroflexota bacterium]|nr:sugar transferase [Chloroflexota bacterium]
MASKPKNGTEAGISGVIRDGYKRPFDLTIIVLAHILLLPLFAVLWIGIPLAIWLGDRGPPFYLQERVGRSGKRFQVIKFRTMVSDAESETGPVWAAERDSRTTRIGRFLRAFRLDELPQVINILRGEMSVVGPRPERPELVERFSRDVPGFSERVRVRPGVAGLAQVRGTAQTRPRDKLRYDNLYIETLNPWMDIKLLVLPVWVVLRRSLR